MAQSATVRHTILEDPVTVLIEILDKDQMGVSGESPEVTIRRESDDYVANFATSRFVAAGGTNWAVMDATALNGLYSYTFSRAVWDEAGKEEGYVFGFRNAGTYQGEDAELHTFLSESPGAGLETGSRVTITVQETGGTRIPGAVVQIMDRTGTVRLWVGLTDASGQVRMMLPGTALAPKTYPVYLSDLAHHTFTAPETLTVAGTTAVTYIGVAFAPGHIEPGSVLIYDWEYDAGGVTPVVGGLVCAWTTKAGEFQAAGGIGYIPQKKEATTDTAGYWEMCLAPGKDYDFDMQPIRGVVYRRVRIPASGTARLSTLLP